MSGRNGWVEVRDEKSKKLLFLFDPARDLIEVVQRGERSLVDLQDYRQGGRLAPQADAPDERPADSPACANINPKSGHLIFERRRLET